jgi:hypothetical protein
MPASNLPMVELASVTSVKEVAKSFIMPTVQVLGTILFPAIDNLARHSQRKTDNVRQWIRANF